MSESQRIKSRRTEMMKQKLFAIFFSFKANVMGLYSLQKSLSLEVFLSIAKLIMHSEKILKYFMPET